MSTSADYQFVAGRSAAAIAASVWHFVEHAGGGQQPELAGTLMVALWIGVIASLIATTFVLRGESRRDPACH